MTNGAKCKTYHKYLKDSPNKGGGMTKHMKTVPRK